jgi:NADP-dependent 3-hydroxy acid dehydrogenase YdfG
MVQTEFRGAFQRDTDRHQMCIKVSILQPEDIADIIHFVVSRPYHINIADLVVMSTAQASSTIVKKKLNANFKLPLR